MIHTRMLTHASVPVSPNILSRSYKQGCWAAYCQKLPSYYKLVYHKRACVTFSATLVMTNALLHLLHSSFILISLKKYILFLYICFHISGSMPNWFMLFQVFEEDLATWNPCCSPLSVNCIINIAQSWINTTYLPVANCGQSFK